MGAQWKQKGKTAAADAKGRVFTKLTKEIIIAAKGGADPAMNPRLRVAVDAAKRASMPKDTLERAIKKGAGLLDESVQYDTVVYEGFAPHRVPVMVECLTDNKNRTATSVRVLFRKGQLGNSGSVSWDFTHLGMIDAAAGAGAPDAETAAIEAGAQDLEVVPGGEEKTAARFFTNREDLYTVSKALQAAGWEVTQAELGYRAKDKVQLSDEQRAEVEEFLAELDDHDDVQRFFSAID